jgi:hypothetical protein
MMSRCPALLFLSLCIVLVAGLAACSPSQKRYSETEIEFLASDAHVIVGDVPLVVPFVALTGLVSAKHSFSLNKSKDREVAKERLEEFRISASSQDTAPTIDNLEITMRTYGWDDFDTSLIGICSRFTRQWSRSVCNDPSSPLQQAMPNDNNHIFLVDDRKLDAFQNHRRVSDQLREMHLKSGETSLVCDTKSTGDTTLCTAAIAIERHLVAVWSIWGSTTEANSRQAEREGAAIKAFVVNALGPTENFPSLLSLVCELNTPAIPTGPRKNPCGLSPISRP